jgi:hypothetical protein
MRSFSALMGVCLVSGMGCAPEDEGGKKGGGDGPQTLEYGCDLGLLTEEGDFRALEPNETVELVLGFQGFLFVEVAVRAEASPGECITTSSLTVPDNDPVGSVQQEVPFGGSDSGWVSEELVLFLPSNTVSDYVGAPADLAVRLDDGAAYCIAALTVELVDDDPCIHTGDEPICPDDDDFPEGEGT